MAVVTYAGKPKKRFKWRRNIAIALLLYTVIGFFVVPAVIKSQMVKRLPGLTHRQATVEQVKFNPYALSLTIRGFALKETNGEVFSSFDEFYINFQPVASLFKWGLVFKDISLKKPFAQVTHRADGTFNFANLFGTNAPPPPPTKPPGPPPRVIIYHLSITNGGVAFTDLDRKETFQTAFTPINLDLTNLTTIRDRNSPYSFVARTGEGETFAWAGSVTVNPLRSAGKFRLGGISLKKYSPYAHDFARYEIAGGLLDVAADYNYDSLTNALDLSLSNAAVHLNQFELKSPDTGESLVAIPTLAITDTEASAARMTARVGLIKSSGGSLLVRREADGSINLLSLLKLPTNAPAATPVATTNAGVAAGPGLPPLVARIDEIAFDDYAFKIEDKKPAQPAAFNIDRLGFDLKGVSNLTNAPVAASFWLRFAESGFVGITGSATLMPPSADLQIALTNIDLRPIQPYVHEQLKLVLTGGTVDMQAHARYAAPEPGAPLATFTGNLSVSNFDTTDDVLFKDFAKWNALNVDGINAEVDAAMRPKLRVDQVKFTGLETSLIVGPDHRANLQTILQIQPGATNAATNLPAPAATVAMTNAAPKQPLPDVALGAFVLENAALHYSDQSIEPHASFDVQEFGGTVSGLSSDPKSTATVNLTGKVDARSPFTVTGKVNPLATNLFVDIAVAFTNTELTPFSPYSEKYAGRPLNKGKLSFAVHYLIDDKALTGENYFYVDQLTLGDKNNSPDATKLPVKLAIALLKDLNGRISLPVPISGRTDDPKFRVGPIIWQVVVNLLEKAATSPFSLLGAIVGGGGEELSYVNFEPGQFEIPTNETVKLDKLATALHERPALTLEITGSVDPARDSYLLAQHKLEQELKTAWVKEQTDAGKPAVSLEQATLQPSDFDRLLKKKHRADIGPYVPTPVPTNAAGGADTNSIAALLAALPPEVRSTHGATLLRAPINGGPVTAPKGPPAPAAAVTAAAPPHPMTRAELELADMEDQLVRKIAVTGDDFRDLMQQRANQVQAYLLKTQKVTADRLFIMTPKPVDAASKGEDRVNLSLD